MSTPPMTTGPRRTSADGKKTTPGGSSVLTRNGARQAKIQTRAVAANAAKPSATLLAAKKKAMQRKKTSGDTVVRDHYQTAMDSKHVVRGETGLATDPRMAEHRCLWDPDYPECPERLTSVIQRCEELGLLERCKRMQPRAATPQELSTLHSPLVHDIMQSTHRSSNTDMLEEVSSKFDAVYIHPSTHELALLAAGSTIDLVESIVKGELQNGVALVRPPGHHAMKSEPCGYCFYNNAALAVRRAVDELGVKRVLIVDWDVHHGQATQQMFYGDPRVVYFSVHRYEHGAFWPNLRQSNFNYVGCGDGRGFNFNVPLNQTKMQDADYLAIWHQLLLPMAFEYQPELIVVSAGFDAALGCPEGEMEVTPACYAHLTHMLQGVCPAVCVVLEGGYCLASLAEGAALTLRTLLGRPPPRLQPLTPPTSSVRESILNCIYAHKQHWRCFNYQPSYSTDTSVLNVDDEYKEKHTVEVRWEGDESRPDRFPTRDCYPHQSHHFLADVRSRLNHLRMVTELHMPQHPVCYVYDEAMLKHKNVCEPSHVECPERIMRIHERHRDYGLLARLQALSARRATDDEILLVHSRQHLERLQRLAATKLRDLNMQKETFDSVYFHPDSFESASVAAGCVLQMVDAVLGGEGGCGTCVVRPPGHHAGEDTPSGFCLLNNAACAARYATECHALRRILLLDWDVHHGNGTQSIFEEDPRVLYVSLHRYDNGSFFPHSKLADYTSVGSGRGEGFNVNIPWNKRGMSDPEYLAAFTNVVLPIAYEYDPELVIVSAGFDACVGDPLGGCKVSPECYGRMTHLLRGLAGGRVILCLEGGYNTTSISYAMTMCTKALLGDPLLSLYDPELTYHWSAIESINNVISVHKKYWKNLQFQVALPKENVLKKPVPSRGLVVIENEISVLDRSDKLESSSFNTSTSTLDDTAKSDQYNLSILENIRKSINSLDESLEDSLANLRITRPKCEEGNCGTDDENDDRPCKSSDSPSNDDNPDKNIQGPNKDPHSVKVTNKVSLNTPPDSSASDPRIEEANQTLVEYLSSQMGAIVNEELFAVIPLPWCPHLESLFSIPAGVSFEQGVKCVSCDSTEENWVCLHCYVVACARAVRGHMQQHCQHTRHALLLSLTDLSVWCNVCDAYVDHPLLYDAKNLAHLAKFAEPLPWCYHDRSDTAHAH